MKHDCGNCNHHWQAENFQECCPNCNSWYVMTTDQWCEEDALEEVAVDHDELNGLTLSFSV